MLKIKFKFSPLPVLAAVAWSAGFIWRFEYIFHQHPAANFIFSDMKGYVELAQRLAIVGYHQTIFDTIYPPGYGFLLAWLYRLDPSWQLAYCFEWVFSSLVPLLIYGIGRALYGEKVAYLSLIISSLYFPFIDYAGYFLTEMPFMFFLNLGTWFLILSLRGDRRYRAYGLAAAGGIAWVAATSFKTHGAIVFGMLALATVAWAIAHRNQTILKRLGVSLLTFVIFICPLTIRATRLTKSFCLVANNGAYNFLASHLDRRAGAQFTDGKFIPPARAARFYPEISQVPFSIFDSQKIYAHVIKWIIHNPITGFSIALENTFDMFFSPVWPSYLLKDFQGTSVFFQEIFYLVILFPALLYLVRRRTTFAKWQKISLSDLLSLSPLLTVVMVGFFIIGESRYRIPFDGFLILLASCAFLKSGPQNFGLKQERI